MSDAVTDRGYPHAEGLINRYSVGMRPRGPVLIVEDDPTTSQLLEKILSMKGYETVTTDDGLDALAYLRGGGMPCAIILDVYMPNMDGMSFQRALQADDRWAAIPVVIFSAAPPSDGEGAVAIVTKGSTSPDVLLDALAAACGRTSN
jgi:CheY-like chemotaxis protein